MKTIKFLRKGATIRTINSDGSIQEEKTYFDPNNSKYPSINAAKRESRKLQNCAGGCGDQSLRVVTKFKS